MTAFFSELQERYFNDTHFRTIVDMMHSMMLNSKITPYELRDAAYVASIKFTQTHIEPLFVQGNFPDDADGILKSMRVPTQKDRK